VGRFVEKEMMFRRKRSLGHVVLELMCVRHELVMIVAFRSNCGVRCFDLVAWYVNHCAFGLHTRRCNVPESGYEHIEDPNVTFCPGNTGSI
jgi:hypothetical protein